MNNIAQYKYNVLSTRNLDFNLIGLAKTNSILIDEISFIKTKNIVSEEVKKQINNFFTQKKYAVFTSMNAVDSVINNLENKKPNWKIYCTGNTTNKLIASYFGKEKIIETANSATDLANVIVKNKDIQSILFFCGNQRREELPKVLKEAKINVNEIVVYETEKISAKINKQYDGILFFSPSAVESFFASNSINSNTVLFAIGNTTATTIKNYTSNKIIISSSLGKQHLTNTMIDYFSNKN